MAGYIIFENVAITNIIDDITVKAKRDYNTSPYVGGVGSNTNFVSQLGRVLSFKSVCPKYEESLYSKEVEGENGEVKTVYPIQQFRNLADEYKSKTGVLTSESRMELAGNYLISGFDVTEDTGNNFTINWEFTEVNQFNQVKQTFRVWGSAPKASSNKSKTTSKKSGNKLSSSSEKLLISCGTLKPSNKVSKCVKYLQKFLQSQGYYKKGKIDGKYGSTTKAEVKKLQKKCKLKVTGNWDNQTILYFHRKYKIGVIGKVASVAKSGMRGLK